jgi:hypothetical protein
MKSRPEQFDDREASRGGRYEPPRVERVLTPAELEREVLYAGDTTGADQ